MEHLPMTTYCYLRVSTDEQDVQAQRHGVMEYCAKLGLKVDTEERDKASGRMKWQERKLGNIILSAKAGDNIVVSEISRLGRSMLQVLEIFKECKERKITMHTVKERIVLSQEDDMTTTIQVGTYSMLAEIERQFISRRTKEGLAAKKQLFKERGLGERLGKPSKPNNYMKLDPRREDFDNFNKMGLSIASIAKLLDVSRPTLYNWMKARNLTLNRKAKNAEQTSNAGQTTA